MATQANPKHEPDGYRKTRLTICKACEHQKLMVCTVCGCSMHAKTALKWASCPRGKWK